MEFVSRWLYSRWYRYNLLVLF